MSFEQPTRRWLMFLLRPADVLELLHIVSNPTSKFAAAPLPRDVRPVQTFWDDERGFLGVMLESEFFEPTPVFERDGVLLGDYPRSVMSLGTGTPDAEELWGPANEEGAVEELHRRAGYNLFDGLQSASEREFRVRALNFSAEDLLLILRAEKVLELPVFPIYPRDTRILGAISQEKLGLWSIFLEHSDFPPATLREDKRQEMVFVEFESDGHDLDLRIGLPGAKITKKITLDEDEINRIS